MTARTIAEPAFLCPALKHSLLFGAALMWLLALCGTETLAGEAEVLIVADEGRESLAGAVQLELDTLGFETAVERPPADAATSTGFIEMSGRAGTVALIRIPDDRSIAEIWTRDRETGKIAKRDVHLSDQDQTYPYQAAVEIAELVRASRIELVAEPLPEDDEALRDEVSPSTPGELPPSTPDEDTSYKEGVSDTGTPPPRAKGYRLMLEAGGGIAAGTFEHPPTAQLTIGAHWRLFNPLGVALVGCIPLTATRVEAEAGAASVRSGLIGLQVRLSFAKLAKRFKPDVGGGIGLAMSRVEGEANPGWSPKSKTALAAMLHLRAGGAVVLTRRLALAIGAMLGRSLRVVAVMIGDERALEWGRVVVLGFIGLEIGTV